MDWLELISPDKRPELFWGAVAGGATFIACLVFWLLAGAGRRRKLRRIREERTIRIYERFVAPETYITVVAPMTGVSLKWRLLPEPARREYRAATRASWVGVAGESPESIRAATRPPTPAGDFLQDHHWTLRPTGAFSEHHALASYLQFWVMIDKLRLTKSIDAALCRSLFMGHFVEHWQFISKFREDIKQNLTASDIEPEWIKATEHLEVFFI